MISNSPKDNVILFPRTIEYYQVQLTRLLETEQYAEAIRLLQFLLQCQGDNRQVYDEWKALLDWLLSQFNSHDAAENEPESDQALESEILNKHVQAKMSEDQNYAKKLLDMLLQDTSTEKKFLALDQLVFIDHPHINDTLKRWVETVDLHPLVQFKVLQTLKLRGVSGQVDLIRCTENVSLFIEQTPLTYEEYPEAIRMVMDRVHQISEINHPALGYFAEQTWKAFLSFTYGTAAYEQIVLHNEISEDNAVQEAEHHVGQSNINIWAAALHHISLETMLGSSSVEETFELYELSDELGFRWELAYRYMRTFVETAFRSNS